MITLDSSALISVLFKEPDYEIFLQTIEASPSIIMSTVNYVESSMVFYAKHSSFQKLDTLLNDARVEFIAPNEQTAQIAKEAFVQFGKGNHPAGLNICDCFAYALARYYDAPLLFKGDDFSKTDVISAL